MALAEKALKAMDAACWGLIPRLANKVMYIDAIISQRRHLKKKEKN